MKTPPVHSTTLFVFDSNHKDVVLKLVKYLVKCEYCFTFTQEFRENAHYSEVNVVDLPWANNLEVISKKISVWMDEGD